MDKPIIGWDVGGAHLKAILIDSNGLVLKAEQVACPLWKGMDQLAKAVQCVMQSFNKTARDAKHAVTMTGELVDLFDNRVAGVKAIAGLMTETISKAVCFYRIAPNMDDCFIDFTKIDQFAKAVASANWHASAQWLAAQLPEATFIDIGSTTTDVVLIQHHQPVLHGLSDAERMQQGSLVYTGVVRTPVMAIAQTLTIDGQQTVVAAEHFATMADVYRLTNELPTSADVATTADGADKSVLSSARRLARMVGYDVQDKPMHVWTALAEDCRQAQINLLASITQQRVGADAPIIGAGSGAFLVEALAKQLGQPYQHMETLFDAMQSEASIEQVMTCFPAYAIAQLALGRLSCHC